MIQLSIQQYDVVQRYTELLDTIEEAFEYIVASFQNLERTQGDQVLADIILAFSSVAKTNEDLLILFKDQQEVLHSIHYFDGVISEVAKLEGQFENQEIKQQLIKANIYPSYLAWKQQIQKQLAVYVIQ